ncbi:MAG: hypothetical protein Q8M26_14355 [Pseudolabrys sp.]|nr:hypothetical protein [Pseudolabrys sp.]
MRSLVSGLCTTALLGAMLSAAVAQDRPIAPPSAPAQAALAPDVTYGRFIAMIRGHLLTGDHLVAARRWDAAARHFGFPREEVYGVIRADLRAYQTPAFEGDLRTLVRVAKARSPRALAQARRNVDKALAAADANLKARVPDWPRYVTTVAVQVLKVAPDEYEDAVVKGRIVRPIGYQTARGFILQADRMIETVGPDLPGSRSAALAEVRAGLAQLKNAFAAVIPPGPAVMDPAAMTALVARIEAAAAPLM